jgi:peptide/nickel transport system substrate-binding protein
VLDAPGPWGTGPFVLSQGYSSIYNVEAVISTEPFSSTWITTKEDRTPYVVLNANIHYWNKERGPRLNQVVFRNDLSKKEALRLCLTMEGQVDIVTGVSANDAAQVSASPYAKLVNVNGNKILMGAFNRYLDDVDFNDRRLRLAFNLAVNRERFIQGGFNGYANVVPALTPPWAFDFPEELKPRDYNPLKARGLLKESGWPSERPLQLATTKSYKKAAFVLASELQEALRINVNVMVIKPEEEVKWRRVVAEKKLVPSWDILLVDTTALFLEGTPAFFHREYFGADGALRTGPVLSEFEALFKKMTLQTNRVELLEAAEEIDRYSYKEVLGLFLCSPQDLYAVNKYVNFRPYRTTFELADTEVSQYHWSRR